MKNEAEGFWDAPSCAWKALSDQEDRIVKVLWMSTFRIFLINLLLNSSFFLASVWSVKSGIFRIFFFPWMGPQQALLKKKIAHLEVLCNYNLRSTSTERSFMVRMPCCLHRKTLWFTACLILQLLGCNNILNQILIA